jgi:hypothetical protein
MKDDDGFDGFDGWNVVVEARGPGSRGLIFVRGRGLQQGLNTKSEYPVLWCFG